MDEYTYTGLKSLASYLNIILVPVKGNEEGMDIDALKTTCKKEQPKGCPLRLSISAPNTLEDLGKALYIIKDILSNYRRRIPYTII